MMNKVLRENISLQNHNALLSLADWWNEQALGSNEIYKKYPEHLALYYKKWRKIQSAKEALRQLDLQLLKMRSEEPSVPKSHRGDHCELQEQSLQCHQPATLR
jgi:hypothetical protein